MVQEVHRYFGEKNSPQCRHGARPVTTRGLEIKVMCLIWNFLDTLVVDLQAFFLPWCVASVHILILCFSSWGRLLEPETKDTPERLYRQLYRHMLGRHLPRQEKRKRRYVFFKYSYVEM